MLVTGDQVSAEWGVCFVFKVRAVVTQFNRSTADNCRSLLFVCYGVEPLTAANPIITATIDLQLRQNGQIHPDKKKTFV